MKRRHDERRRGARARVCLLASLAVALAAAAFSLCACAAAGAGDGAQQEQQQARQQDGAEGQDGQESENQGTKADEKSAAEIKAKKEQAEKDSAESKELDHDPYANGIHHAEMIVAGYEDTPIEIEVHSQDARRTSALFCKLANEGFYDGKSIYWIVKDLYARFGDRSGESAGQHWVRGEYREAGIDNNLSLRRGWIAMSRTEDGYNSDASSLVLLLSDASYLDGKYATFAKITSGIEVFDKISAHKISARTESKDAAEKIELGPSGKISDETDCPVITSIRMVD